MSEKKKICVTGVAGFLGSHLAEHLLKQGHKVFGVDNMVGGDWDNIPNGVDFVEKDTSDFESMLDFLGKTKPDVIYHTACTAYEGFSVFSPSFIIQNTLQNTAGILSASINQRVKRFVYCSSMSRYGKQPTPFTEDMETAPEDPYALAKVSSEKLIRMMADTHNFEFVIAVPHNIIGPRQKYDDPYRNVASIFINRILLGKPPIIYGDGEQTRSFSFVDDCIDTLLKMIDCPSGEVYNIGPDDKDGEVVTINQLYWEIADLMGFKEKPIYMPDRPREVKHAFCSSDKIRREFGYQTKTKLREGLAAMIEEIKKRGVREFKYHLPLEIEDGAPRTWRERLM